ncbi:Protein POLE-2 [Aphelenchoides avenae]|nr:Protein POLE-2 [Aphelenchus avenae]
MSINEVVVKREIKMLFEIRNITLASSCLDYLLRYALDNKMSTEARQKFVENLAPLLQHSAENGTSVTLPVLQKVVKQSRGIREKDDPPFVLQCSSNWQHSEFDVASKRFIPTVRTAAWDSKVYDSMRKRYQLVESAIDETCRYVHIEYLYPRNGTDATILAMLTRDGSKFIAEDLTGHLELQLDLSKAKFAPGLFFEGGIFLFKGHYDERVLTVHSVALPVLKANYFPRGYLVETSGKLEPDDRIVFLSDVWLDCEKVVSALYQMLSAFSTSPPEVFVLCGHFLSLYRAHGYTEAATKSFAHLARILGDFKRQFSKTQFVLVPGPDDPAPMTVMPRPGLPPFVRDLFKDLPNVHFATNPCRILYKGQSIVICRDDTVERLCRAAIHVPAQTSSISQCVTDTIWSQRHFSPLPLHANPVLPHMDYLFFLAPCPDVLVVADKFKPFAYVDNASRRLTINPGPFQGGTSFKDRRLVQNFAFHVYYPLEKKVDASEIV